LYAVTSLRSVLPMVAGYPAKRQDLTIATTFEFDTSCAADQQTQIKQANSDALLLAIAALQDSRELLADGESGKYVAFDTQATVDCWSIPDKNGPYQQRIFDTFYRATHAYRGSGWSDWWNDKYVFVFCRDVDNSYKENSVAYTVTNFSNAYPEIIYCPNFFKLVPPHSSTVNKIRGDVTEQMKLNVRNLRSQATTALHECLHIRNFAAQVCQGGCFDTSQVLGGEVQPTYKAGRAKLLAQRDAEAAASTNDNYVYFAMSNWMQQNFGTYPIYPHVWDSSKTLIENQAIEDQEPGSPGSLQSWELDDNSNAYPGEAIVDISPAPASDYPAWYQPVINAASATTVPELDVPPETQLAYATPDIDSVVCQTTDDPPQVTDCVHAFGSVDQFPSEGALEGKLGSTWWAGVSNSTMKLRDLS